MKDKILAIGNYKDAMYHPFGGVDICLKEMFPQKEIICTDDTGSLLSLKAGGFKGVISYLDIWEGALSEDESKALACFVEQGGALLLLHNGISIQSRDELRLMMGGKFLTHPPQEEIEFVPGKHAITAGCDSFKMDEEPYQFELEEDNKEIFLTYLYRGKEYVAGWSKQVGAGKLVFLTPGHTALSFKEPEYIKLIQNSLEWCLK